MQKLISNKLYNWISSIGILNNYINFNINSLLYLIESKELNKNLKWIKDGNYHEEVKLKVNKYENFEDINQAENLIKILDDLETENSYNNEVSNYKEDNNVNLNDK